MHNSFPTADGDSSMEEARGLKLKRMMLFRPPIERLLLSIIDANPDASADMEIGNMA